MPVVMPFSWISGRTSIRLESKNETANRGITTTICLCRHLSRFQKRMGDLRGIRQRGADLESRHRTAPVPAGGTADEQHSSRAGWHLDHLRNGRRRHRVLGPKDRTTFSLNQDSRGVTVKQLAGEPPSKRSGALYGSGSRRATSSPILLSRPCDHSLWRS